MGKRSNPLHASWAPHDMDCSVQTTPHLQKLEVDPAYISLNASIRELEETVQDHASIVVTHRPRHVGSHACKTSECSKDERLHMPDKTEIDNNGSWCVCS